MKEIISELRERNKKWALIYLSIGLLMLSYAAWKEDLAFYIATIIMMLLAGFRLFILPKILKIKQ